MSSIQRIVDMHADIPWDVVHKRNDSAKHHSVLESNHYEKLKSGGIAGFNAVVWVESEFKPNRALARGLEIVDAVHEDVKASEHFALAFDGKSFAAQAREGEKIAMILGVEGGELIEKDLGLLRTFWRLGVRIFGFVWNERNLLADGYSEVGARNGGSGLSEFGKKVVEECNSLGIILDGAHITPNGLSDMLATTKRPMIVSHGSTRVHPGTLRPLSDEHLKEIRKNGGVAGIFAINMKGSMPTLESYLDHIEYAVKQAGIDHVGIGFDFVDYIGHLSQVSNATYIPGLASHRDSQRAIEGLKERGWKESDISKVASENFLRVLSEA